MSSLGLGRRRVFDARDLKYPMKAILPKRISLTQRYWNDNNYWADQGDSSMCVAYSLVHWLQDGPVCHKGVKPIIQQKDLYKLAQAADEWEGEDYDGTSVRAGASVLQSKGLIKEYRWAFDLPTMVDAILSTGPVVVGTTWYDDMFEPNSKGVIGIGGSAAGGHAYVINGVNTKTKMFRIKNSWGKSWGLNGRAYISFEDFDVLIKDAGEIMLAIEVS